MSNLLLTERAKRAEVNSRLLAVRAAVKKDLSVPGAPAEAGLLRDEQDVQDILPLLVLIPLADKPAAEAVRLAVSLELAYLAGRIHDLACRAEAPPRGSSILIGDYLYALSAARLNADGYDSWLGKVGRSLARRAEAAICRLQWAERAYVPEDERLANLHKEHAEAISLAAGLAAEASGMNEAETAAYTEFGFHLGVLQGMRLYGCDGAAYMQAKEQSLAKAEAAVSALPQVSPLAKLLLLAPLSAEGRRARPKTEEPVSAVEYPYN